MDMRKPTQIVDITTAEEQFFELVERAHNGEEILLAQNGELRAKLISCQASYRQPRMLGFLGIELSEATNAELLKPLSDDELEVMFGDDQI
jgi:antitoxin (DNA-binding transcriptional repressor) of toxin-antitoxin stability system